MEHNSGFYNTVYMPTSSAPPDYNNVTFSFTEDGSCEPELCPLASPESSIFTLEEDMEPSLFGSENLNRGAEEGQAESQQPAQKPKRKRENRYKNAPPAVISRRRAQNRASQRAYRERKDKRIKDLESIINEIRQMNDYLTGQYNSLKDAYDELKLRVNEQGAGSEVQHDASTWQWSVPYPAGPPDLSNQTAAFYYSYPHRQV
ncbi:hypothetical protein F4777DRAFT_534882 [Nemania sp. FL0916]|nr:hypothetical protein F4777DRAFT_534882 [Nemania sp. FL0916]